ncbi:protein downstream neighbor of Son [Vigna unguiculata]|uniref:protein downstream neighbor of Son n=1 Tax=Vigna unguiculata TaxID=3917 RepID=UPI001015F494|nr:protein downstream neighbor of Son [Vigna unguiculata]XP_027914948.1 protein downstream neighbor of Son [Vigna unguiculata]
MAKVAKPSSHRIGSGPMVKKKTPSELRGELLKRASFVDNNAESPPLLADPAKTTGVSNGLKRTGLWKPPRYTDTRVDEVFAAKKPRFKIASGKENAKEIPSLDQTSNLKNLSVFSNLEAKRQQENSCSETSDVSSQTNKDSVLQPCQTFEKCSQGKFLSVSELSTAVDKCCGSGAIDLGKALRGLAAPEEHYANDKTADLADGYPVLGNFLSECNLPGQKVPLDLTIKTSMRIVSSSKNCSVMRGTMPQLAFQNSYFRSQNVRGSDGLHSWIYPQSILPPSVISVLSSSTSDGELDFLRKRQVAWEESFRDLYYMLRKDICGLFYVCTAQFVVMFTGGDSSGKSKCSCNAYISQSTQGLRSLLREHDVCFSMPLCHSKVEQVATEDLVELSEIEKQNLGQIRRLRSFSEVDNSSQSLLVFSGNNNVHALYDLLLNYRFLLTSLSSMDTPVLCSPVPFQNSALSSPDIKYTETRRAEDIAASYNGSIWKDGESIQGSSDGLCTIEIKDALLPPWIICRMCALMSSEGRSFEASFATDFNSIGLNIALKSMCEKAKSEAGDSESLQEGINTFGIPETVVTPQMCSSSLKGVKYSDGSYMASLSPA